MDDKKTLSEGTMLKSAKRQYKVEEVLGMGGFDITYKVSSVVVVDNIPVKTFFCVKEHFVANFCSRADDNSVIVPASQHDSYADSLKAFKSEAVRLNALSGKCKGIVRVNEVFCANNTAYYVMEFLNGCSLRSDVLARGKYDEHHALHVMKRVGDSLAFMHSKKITHLDVKPANIMLHVYDNDSEAYPVLIDFGLAKHYDNSGTPTSQINVGGVSNGYSPVEQYVRIDRFSPVSDVYSLAATLFFMLTGKDPEVSLNVTETYIRKHLSAVAGERTCNAVVRAMRRNTDDRTQTMDAFLADLGVASSCDDIKVTQLIGGKKSVKRKFPVWAFCLIAVAVVSVAVALAFHLTDNNGVRTVSWQGGRYHGEVVDGVPHGEGRFERDGMTYEGRWERGELSSGKVTSDKYIYEGALNGMRFNGYGVCRYKDGHSYRGYWHDDSKDALGLLQGVDGSFTFCRYRAGVAQVPDGQQFAVGTRVYGIDVSRHQGTIGWQDLYLGCNSRGGVDGTLRRDNPYMQPVFFAIAKSTQGGTLRDSRFETNYSEAKRCGKICGAYHFLTLNVPGREQARFFIANTPLGHGDLPPVLDLEKNSADGRVVSDNEFAAIVPIAREWIDEVKKHYGVAPIIYTNMHVYSKIVATDKVLSQCDLWLAKPGTEWPHVKRCVLWQFTHHGKAGGITDNDVDINLFDGSYRDFEAYLAAKGVK